MTREEFQLSYLPPEGLRELRRLRRRQMLDAGPSCATRDQGPATPPDAVPDDLGDELAEMGLGVTPELEVMQRGREGFVYLAESVEDLRRWTRDRQKRRAKAPGGFGT